MNLHLDALTAVVSPFDVEFKRLGHRRCHVDEALSFGRQIDEPGDADQLCIARLRFALLDALQMSLPHLVRNGDRPEAGQLASHILPATDCLFGRPGNPASHYLYHVEHPEKITKMAFK